MNDREFVYTYRTKIGTFRIQSYKTKFALFIDFPRGDWDMLTSCVSVSDGIEYVERQDTGLSDWDDLSSVPDKVGDIEAWHRRRLVPRRA
jgi:hypothetical protein